MTVLSAMQSAALRLVGRKLTAFFSSTGQFEREIVDLVNEVATDIVQSHDWQALTFIATITGDGSTTEFPLPADYDRMKLAQHMQDGKSWFWGYTRVQSLDEWISLQSGGWAALSPGWWILLQNQFQFYPAPGSGAEAKYPYVSKLYARDKDNAPKAAFTADDDSFALDERLLTLALIWRWREMKRIDATGDMENFTKAFDERSARDGGSRTIRKNGGRVIHAAPAWPWVLG
jgi:hypothetical protein